MHVITADTDAVFALPPTDGALERAERILHGRALRLGKDYAASHDGVVVTDATAIACPQTDSLRLELEAHVHPDATVGLDDVHQRIAAILEPLLHDARARMNEELGCEVLATIQVRLVLPARLARLDG